MSIAIVALGAAATIVLAMLGMAYWSTHPPRIPVRRTPGDNGLAYEEIEFLAGDGLRISGWWIPSPQPRGVVILCHGHPDNRERMLGRACRLHEAGFHTVLFDFRAMGRSDGKSCTLGATEHAEVRAAVGWVLGRADCTGLRIGLFGLSMGGSAALQAAADTPEVAAIITHGTYATLERAIRRRMRYLAGPAEPILMPLASALMGIWIPRPLADVSPAAAAARMGDRPLLVIHGGADRMVSPADALELQRSASGPAELYILKDAAHAVVPEGLRGEYDSRVATFFQRTLPTDQMQDEAAG